ncbi:MAG: hypothetical protein MI755_21190 [Sphingomonadales bacterium]|nr:hypothetical protein [Sphingomonadales bacterium]
MGDLFQRIQAAESGAVSLISQVDNQLRRQHAKDQSRIAWVIIWAFVASLGVVFLIVLLQWAVPLECVAITDGDKTEVTCPDAPWKPPAEFLLAAISSVMLPVVTLVLGYYFGKETKK